jgi:hypothetical protein
MQAQKNHETVVQLIVVASFLEAVHGHDALVVPRAFRQICFVRRLHFNVERSAHAVFLHLVAQSFHKKFPLPLPTSAFLRLCHAITSLKKLPLPFADFRISTLLPRNHFAKKTSASFPKFPHSYAFTAHSLH